MKRGEIWWAELPAPAGRRPVVLLSRDEAYSVRELVTIAPVTTRVRGLAVEVPLGREDGMPKACAANLDTITTVPKAALKDRITYLRAAKRRALDDAIRFALALDEAG
ncbi:MAG TPA: type II toxin-antitoxin system PemK/MazF family toxin [Planctomycetota bacterium]|nr:type II toxin-antitoxin system PemK/MazF family toxin [Planctomycetota bacterium]